MDDDELSAQFDTELPRLMKSLALVVHAAMDEPTRSHMRELEPWFKAVFEAAVNPDFLTRVSTQWLRIANDDPGGELRTLILIEIRSYSNVIHSRAEFIVVAPTPDRLLAPQTKRANTLARKAEQKDYLNAGSTLLESLMDALGDLAPKVRGILKSVKEAVDVAKG